MDVFDKVLSESLIGKVIEICLFKNIIEWNYILIWMDSCLENFSHHCTEI